MSLYLDCLPSDLLAQLFLYFSRKNLAYLLPNVKNIGKASRILDHKVFAETIWRRDISSLSPLPYFIIPLYQELCIRFDNFTLHSVNIRYLIVYGYDVLLYELLSIHKSNITNDIYNDILGYAAYYNQIAIMNKMIELGADDYMAALIDVASTDNIEALKILISKSNHVDFDALLDMAAYDGKITMVKYLINHGATYYSCAMDNAIFKGRTEVVKIFLEKGINNLETFLETAQSKGYIDIVDLIQEYINNR